MTSHDKFKQILENKKISYESSISFGEMLGITIRGSATTATTTKTRIQEIAPCTCSNTQNDLTTIWTFPNQTYQRLF